MHLGATILSHCFAGWHSCATAWGGTGSVSWWSKRPSLPLCTLVPRCWCWAIWACRGESGDVFWWSKSLGPLKTASPFPLHAHPAVKKGYLAMLEQRPSELRGSWILGPQGAHTHYDIWAIRHCWPQLPNDFGDFVQPPLPLSTYGQHKQWQGGATALESLYILCHFSPPNQQTYWWRWARALPPLPSLATTSAQPRHHFCLASPPLLPSHPLVQRWLAAVIIMLQHHCDITAESGPH